TYFCARWILYG
nr:immunoglobulin heavy chain junction region [Mus musculus]